MNQNGSLKSADDWTLSPTRIRCGAALGANSTIRCGIEIGAWAMVGSGSVVTRDVPDYGLVFGNPARLRGFVCACGGALSHTRNDGEQAVMTCPDCRQETHLPAELVKRGK